MYVQLPVPPFSWLRHFDNYDSSRGNVHTYSWIKSMKDNNKYLLHIVNEYCQWTFTYKIITLSSKIWNYHYSTSLLKSVMWKILVTCINDNDSEFVNKNQILISSFSTITYIDILYRDIIIATEKRNGNKSQWNISDTSKGKK